jgi:hypothetical protein
MILDQGQALNVTLTTPVPRDADATFPGEGWFYYWKTSASLWKTKLMEHQKGPFVIVPINWSFHSETGDSFDFAEHRPETDLKKLSVIAHELNKKLIFLLPLTPTPFLPNGGLPHFLARTPSVTEDGLALMAVDSDGTFNKMYSFFDSRVFQAFTRFTHELSQYFQREGITDDVWGLKSFSYCRYRGTRSFMLDRSMVFDQSFTRYLKARHEESGNFVEGAGEEELLRNEYTQTIEKLYVENAKRSFRSHWEGTLSYCFLGASQEDTFGRMANQHQESKYSVDLLEAMTQDRLPSSVLLPTRVKRSVLLKQCEDLVLNSFLLEKLQTYQDEETTVFSPLVHFELVEGIQSAKRDRHDWGINGLLPYLRIAYPFTYLIRANDFRPSDEDYGANERLYFYQGSSIDQTNFHVMLKRFMSGEKVLLDRTYLSDDYAKKLEVFFIENSLKLEKVNFQTSIQNVTLGEGRLVIFEGDKLKALETSKLFNFWQRMIETFSLKLIALDIPESVLYFWRTRPATPHELKYEEIRRLSLYNPSSYKRKFVINLPKNTVLMKVIDPLKTEATPKPAQIEVQMLPEGSVSIDLGSFS